MELITFIQELSRQNIVPRDTVNVSTNVNSISGKLVPCDIIINREGEVLSKIIHERNNELIIVVKTTPDGMGPDIGTPILISEITTIDKIG
jgi:hypothetical protein